MNTPKLFKYILYDDSEKTVEETVDNNAQDDNGDTALMKAMKSREIGLAQKLLQDPNLNPNKKNKQGRTALMLLCSQDIPMYAYKDESRLLLELAQLLLSKGADINMRDNNGYTAVMLAAENAHSLLFKHFMETNRVSDINESSFPSFIGVGAKTTLEIAKNSKTKDYSSEVYTKDKNWSTIEERDKKSVYLYRQDYIVSTLEKALKPAPPAADGNIKRKKRSAKKRKY